MFFLNSLCFELSFFKLFFFFGGLLFLRGFFFEPSLNSLF
ncbi:putative membrane protein [Helicobacter pylori Hp P-62]|nr:putative membrane protein [Helicobacter pylori Hp P-62]